MSSARRAFILTTVALVFAVVASDSWEMRPDWQGWVFLALLVLVLVGGLWGVFYLIDSREASDG